MIKRAISKFGVTQLGRCIRILSRPDRFKIVAVIVIQIIIGFLDLLGVAAIGILGALAVNGIQSKGPGDKVQEALNVLHLGNFSFQTQAAILGSLAALLLIGRTVFSIFFTRKTLFFLSRRGAFISTDLLSKLLSKPLLFVQKRSTQDSLYSITQGVSAILLGVIGSVVSIIADSSALIVLAIGLFVLNPTIALGTILLFSLIGFALYKLLHQRARTLGMKNTKLNIESNEKILEVLNSYREAVVRNRRFFYAKSVGDLRYDLANTQAEVQFMPNISKYVIESSVVLGALVLSAAQFMLEDASHAVATLAVFLAAGTRIAPAILRIQQGAITIRGSLGSASSTLELIEELSDAKVIEETQAEVQVDHTGFQAEVRIANVSLTYPGNLKKAVNNASITIESGSVVALVGPSGAGKTSLVDLILGVLIPDTGTIEISGESPAVAISKWPGALAYVPQDVVITQGSINENVALGFPINSDSDLLVKRALDIAQLSDFVSKLPNGVNTAVGERGTKISGGQRQRLGIARALYTQPKLLVLDEATSALDGQTEADISGAILELKGNTTVIMIAHRLSTVRNADKVVYMDEGSIVATGTFEEVRTLVPDFDSQAALMGL